MEDHVFTIVLNPYRNGTVDETIATTGFWEPLVSTALTRAMTCTSGAFVDIGANIGYHALHIATRFPNRPVHAVEPLPWLREQIIESASRNVLTNLTVHPTGLGSSDAAERCLLVRAENTGSSSFYPMENLNLFAVSDRLTVPITTLDSLRSRMGRIGVIKIDVEGHEPEVLTGARTTLETDRPVIVMECSPMYYRHLSPQTGPDLVKQLAALGYAFFDGDGNSIDLLEWISQPASNQKDITCLPREQADHVQLSHG